MKMGHATYIPVIIVSPPCSGATLLKNCLTQIYGVGAWPYENINHIWCHGNHELNTDELEIFHASNEVKNFVRRKFTDFAFMNELNYVTDITHANCLRVPYINAIFPEAKYIFILRDGRDAVNSFLKQWKLHDVTDRLIQKQQHKYYTDKLVNRIKNIWKKMINRQRKKELPFSFGPRFLGIYEWLNTYTLEQICAMQWKLSIEKSAETIQGFSAEKVIKINYEQLVVDPEGTLDKVLKFMGMKILKHDLQNISSVIHPYSIGKGKRELTNEQLQYISPIIKEVMQSENYLPDVRAF